MSLRLGLACGFFVSVAEGAALPYLADAAALMQQNVKVHADSCGDHNTPELCKKATDWGLCKGWFHDMCLSLTATCNDLKSASQCRKSKELLGLSCRGWGGSSCLSKTETCKDITDEAACSFAQANLGLQCKGWEGRRCLPLKQERSDEELAARTKLREEAKAKHELREKAKETARLLVEKQERQAANAERRRLEEARRQQELDEEQRIAAKEAMRQRHQAKLAAKKAEEEAKAREEEEARLREEEEAKRKAEEDARLEAERKAEEAALKKEQEDEDARRRAVEDQAKQAKFGDALFIHVQEAGGGREVEIKTRRAMRMKALMTVARNRLALPDGNLLFTHNGKEINPSDSPTTLGLQDGDIITVEAQ